MLQTNQSTDLTRTQQHTINSLYSSANQRELQFVCSGNKLQLRSSID